MLRLCAILTGVLAILYGMLYLMSSYSYSLFGILLLLVCSSMVVVKLDKGLKFTVINYVFAGFSLVFAGFLCVWVFHVIRSSISYQYFGNSWLYILITILLIVSIVAQFFLVLFSAKDR